MHTRIFYRVTVLGGFKVELEEISTAKILTQIYRAEIRQREKRREI